MKAAGLRGHPDFAIERLAIDDYLAVVVKLKCENTSAELAIDVRFAAVERRFNGCEYGVHARVKCALVQQNRRIHTRDTILSNRSITLKVTLPCVVLPSF